jgi:hypothetical protein
MATIRGKDGDDKRKKSAKVVTLKMVQRKQQGQEEGSTGEMKLVKERQGKNEWGR